MPDPLTCNVCGTAHPDAAAAFCCFLGCLPSVQPDPALAAEPEPPRAAPAAATEDDEPPAEPECFECGGKPHSAWWVYDAEGVEHPACEACGSMCPECDGDGWTHVDEDGADPCRACGGRGSRAAYEARQERRGDA